MATRRSVRPSLGTDCVGQQLTLIIISNVGYGHDCTEKKDCGSLHPPLSVAQATDLLKKDLVGFEACVCALPNAKLLNANQYGALVSFAYNSGCGGVSSYWHGAMTEKNFKGICEALPNTNTLGGELSSRRQKEGHFCSEPTSQPSGCA
jgi:lysozyme